MYYPYCSDKDYFKHVYTLILCMFREGYYIYVIIPIVQIKIILNS